ncbi:FAD-dependent oxidoreductase [candidate division FCPU426 bacterium]|nr:FAD-dependent oxidoreductase [candidate division FCPU426 bacterium]
MSRPRSKEGWVVLGAGLAGLSTAYHAGPRTPVFEAGARPGGNCVTDQVKGYAFDRSGHLLHLRTDYVSAWMKKLLPGRLARHQRDARVHLLGHEVRYPIQGNLYGLPAGVKAEGLHDYLRAAAHPSKQRPENFQEWARRQYGEKLNRLFFQPYNRKLWTVDPSRLTLEWMGAYVPQPQLERVIRGAFADMPAGGGYNASFWYPRQGGIHCLAQALAKNVPGIRLQAGAAGIDIRRRTVDIKGHGRVPWKRLVSTLPLPVLVSMLGQKPRAVAAAARRLRANSVVVVNLGIARPTLHPAHWLYFPEEKFSFYRVGFPANFGRVAPAGCSSLYAEVAVPQGTAWNRKKKIARQVRHDLLAAGILLPGDKVQVEHLQYLPYAYVIFDQEYASARKTILTFLEKVGILSLGRWGHWEYSAMEDALLAGKKAAEEYI